MILCNDHAMAIEPHDARAVANFILEKSYEENSLFTNLKVLKLVYFSHAWNLALNENPLFGQKVVAWPRGPVVIDVYESLKKYGATGITQMIDVPSESFSTEETDIMNQVFRLYGPCDPFYLSGLTHQPSTPWFRVWNSKGLGAEIPNKMIERHYKEIARQNLGR